MTDLFLDYPPERDKRIRELWVWIITELGGGEGIASADFEVSDAAVRRHMPLQSSRLDIAERLKPAAERAAQQLMDTSGRDTGLRLAHFELAGTGEATERVALLETLTAAEKELKDADDYGARLLVALSTILDAVDYTTNACSAAEEIGEVLSPSLIFLAREAIAKKPERKV